MGFYNSPAYIQRFIDELLQSRQHFYYTFIDNIVVFSDTFNDYIKHLDDVFRLFTSKNISILPKKLYLGYLLVELLSFYIDSLGLNTTASRLKAFKKLEFPATLKALEMYLGAAGFL